MLCDTQRLRVVLPPPAGPVRLSFGPTVLRALGVPAQVISISKAHGIVVGTRGTGMNGARLGSYNKGVPGQKQNVTELPSHGRIV